MMPEFLDIFEKYGFIWGGRWYHYDRMHFEYRPELFLKHDRLQSRDQAVRSPLETSFAGLWSFEEDFDPFRPDLLILHCGIDDAYGSVYRSKR